MIHKLAESAAQSQFTEIVDQALAQDERFLIERSGEPAVMILSVRDYVASLAPPPQWLKEIQDEAVRNGTADLDLDAINSEIAAARRDRRAS